MKIGDVLSWGSRKDREGRVLDTKVTFPALFSCDLEYFSSPPGGVYPSRFSCSGNPQAGCACKHDFFFIFKRI